MNNDKRLIKNVAFFGDANLPESDPAYKEAFETAKLLAGGGGPNVEWGGGGVGGATLSVTFTPKDATGFEGRYVGNVTDKTIKTKNYIERMFKLMEQADAYLIFKGGTGTISELGTAWGLAKLYFGHHKPFILVGGFWRPIIKALEENLNIDKAEMAVFRIADRQEEILPMIREFEEQMQKLDHAHCEVCSEKAFMT